MSLKQAADSSMNDLLLHDQHLNEPRLALGEKAFWDVGTSSNTDGRTNIV